MTNKSVSIISLGCFRNICDSEVTLKKFLNKGYVFNKDIKGSDVLVINTCGFIDKAKEESLEIIRDAIRLKKKGKIKKILVFGCLVERYKRDLERFFPDVDTWQGIEKFNGRFIPRAKITPSYIDFLKICEGCFNKCSYCAIPLIKGPLVSKSQEEVIKEAKVLDKKGIKELNIIGQDITSWGKDFKDKNNLTGLLKDILHYTNIPWIRLIYTHPRHIQDDLLDLISYEERICKYIDLPIQHINDRILKAMNREITKRQIKDLIKKIRIKIPDCIIRTSVILGFPGETEKEFGELLDFLREIKFERLGTFIYSREENTPAYNLPHQVHHSTKQRRLKDTMAVQQEISNEVQKRFLGRQIDVLVEEVKDGVAIGRSRYDAYEVDGIVFLKGNLKSIKPAEIYKAQITGSYEYDLMGEIKN